MLVRFVAVNSLQLPAAEVQIAEIQRAVHHQTREVAQRGPVVPAAFLLVVLQTAESIELDRPQVGNGRIQVPL